MQQSPELLLEALQAFQNTSEQVKCCVVIDEFSHKLARDLEFRVSLPGDLPSIWGDLSVNWRYLERISSENIPHVLVLCLARFTRNLVAGVPVNQTQAFNNEPSIRRLLYSLSSFLQFEDKDSYLATRMLVQCLSNIITMNGILAGFLWDEYSCLPEEQEIISRLLASPDVETVKATLVLVINCIHADQRILVHFFSNNGVRVLIKILDRTEEWAASDNEDDEEVFVVSIRLVEIMLRKNLGVSLHARLSIKGEPVTPHQISFLKILDSFLQSNSNLIGPEISSCDYSFIPRSMSRLALYLRNAVKQSLGLSPSNTMIDNDAPPEQLKDLDLRLPKVSAAVILLAQCLSSICLQVHRFHESKQIIPPGLQTVFNATLEEKFVEDLVDTLGVLDLFLPRIVLGKAAGESGQKNNSGELDTKGFSFLKRDLVRLLGTICHERKNVQDRIRECGGIEVVMKLCVIDERNPYLQEHALFALRNILFKNPENQSVVDSIKHVDGHSAKVTI